VPAGLVAVALLLVFAVVRPAMRQIEPPPVVQAPPVVEKLPAPEEVETVDLAPPKAALQLTAARDLAKQNPAAVANIVRGWVSGEVA
jgi:flagellar M-ring protein FliF